MAKPAPVRSESDHTFAATVEGVDRKLRADAQRNRASILEAAEAEFRAHGVDASMDEIAHHADTHDLFDSVEENRANLLRGMSWVERQLGERTTGYVAPRGLWNGALDQAIRQITGIR